VSAELGLGTAQFGTEYGISNTHGKLTPQEVRNILMEARHQGIKVLDTAALYGSSEEILGQQDLSEFKIVTKTPRFASASVQLLQVEELRETFKRSLSHLKQSSVYALLSHHAEDLLVPGGEKLWQAMEEIKEKGEAQRIGVSIYEGHHLDELMMRYPLDIVQVPINVLDQRLLQGGQLQRLHKAGIEVHARSAFLQGLLLMDEPPAFFDPINHNLKHWHSTVAERGLTTTQAALAFVRNQPGIDVVLVGVNGLSQLTDCVRDFNGGYYFNGEGFNCNIDEFIDPSRWKVK
jgi:aryl-alcohol dehydrogenase-like predicted oxidoreductase